MSTLIKKDDTWYLENMTKAIDVSIFIYDRNCNVIDSFLNSNLATPPTALVKKMINFDIWDHKGLPDINFFATKKNGLIGGFAINDLRVVLYNPVTSDQLEMGSNAFSQVNAKRFRSQLAVLFFHFKGRKPVLLPDQGNNLSDVKIADNFDDFEEIVDSQESHEEILKISNRILIAIKNRNQKELIEYFRKLKQAYINSQLYTWLLTHKKLWLASQVGMLIKESTKFGLDNITSISLQQDILNRIDTKKDIGDPIAYLYSLVLVILEKLKQQGSHETYLVRQVNNELAKNITSKISLSSIANKLHVSKSYLIRTYKANTGYTINQTFIKMKISLAMQRLLFSDVSIQELSNYLGFSSYTYFSTVFKKVTGQSPKYWQKIRRVIL